MEPSLDFSYLGPNWERRVALADLTVVAQGARLPAHRAILEASEVLLELFHDFQAQAQPLVLEAFAGASEAGARLFLACLYQPQLTNRLVKESLAASPEGTVARDLLSLAHLLNTSDLLEGCQRCLCGLVGALAPTSLLDWVAVVERCEAGQLVALLTARAVTQLADGGLSAEAVGQVLASAPSGAKHAEIIGGAVSQFSKTMQLELEVAQSTTAVALADKAYTEAQLEAEVLEREMYQLNHECTLHDLQSQLEASQNLAARERAAREAAEARLAVQAAELKRDPAASPEPKAQL